MEITAYEIARNFIGYKERPGNLDNPFITWCLSNVGLVGVHDEVAWCSAFVSTVFLILGLPRSKSAAARSWLLQGEPVDLKDAKIGWDVVVLKRGDGNQPGPEVIQAQGHVGFFAGIDGDNVLLLAGNQHDMVNVTGFPVERVLGVRRMYNG